LSVFGRLLEELKKKQANLQKDRPDIAALINRVPAQPPPNKRRWVPLPPHHAYQSFKSGRYLLVPYRGRYIAVSRRDQKCFRIIK
jgi:hypothetical protein